MLSEFASSRILTIDEINKAVGRRIGAYVLGYRKGDYFYTKYVGRSDTDLNDRLKDHAYEGKYERFRFIYCNTLKEAHELECSLYHHFKKDIDNEMHPDSPNGKNYYCPICGK